MARGPETQEKCCTATIRPTSLARDVAMLTILQILWPADLPDSQNARLLASEMVPATHRIEPGGGKSLRHRRSSAVYSRARQRHRRRMTSPSHPLRRAQASIHSLKAASCSSKKASSQGLHAGAEGSRVEDFHGEARRRAGDAGVMAQPQWQIPKSPLGDFKSELSSSPGSENEA